MANQRFSATVGSIAQQVGTSEQTIRTCCNLNIVESIRDDTGRRLLKQDAARQLLEHRATTGSFTGGARKS